MSLVDELAKVDELRAELDALRPLPKETEQRVMQKLRLEWNYHSAKIEGGELTFGETKALLLFGITAAQKPLKDHLEMKGHNEAINILLDFTQEKRPLNEFTIRELHQLILGREPFRAEAETADGQRTSRTITPGRYKQEPNHVLTRTGETFYFASPEETGAEMQKLVEWYREEHEKRETHPVLLAAEFHYRFVRIHPFDDGNGRMARLLMNLILMQYGLPPAVIQSDREHKEQYYRVLQAADVGDIEPFIEYVAREVARSLDIMVRAAKGEPIDDPDDVYKEIALMKKQLQNDESRKVDYEKYPDIIQRIAITVIVPLFENVADKLHEIDDLFYRKYISVHYDGKTRALYHAYNVDKSVLVPVMGNSTDISFSTSDKFDFVDSDTNLASLWERNRWNENSQQEITFEYILREPKYSESDITGIQVTVQVHFGRGEYFIESIPVSTRAKIPYQSFQLSEEQQEKFSFALLKAVVNQLKKTLLAKDKEGRQ